MTIDESISRLFQNVQEVFAKDISYWGFDDRLTAVGIVDRLRSHRVSSSTSKTKKEAFLERNKLISSILLQNLTFSVSVLQSVLSSAVDRMK
jgi:hypothetical protein